MKRKFFASIAVGLVITSGIIAPLFGFIGTQFDTSVAQAQLLPPEPEIGPQPNPNPETPDETAPEEPRNVSTSGDALNCDWTQFLCNIVVGFTDFFMFVPILLSTVTGIILDFSVWYSIQSSTYTKYDGETGNDGLVVTGWKLVRDFTNLVFIFALFAVAFTLILGISNSPLGDPKRTIASVIIMALLVNFSFFLARSVIDVTNLMALGFYNKITLAPEVAPVNTGSSKTEGFGDPLSFHRTNAVGIRSISTGILAQVNPQTLILKEGGGNTDYVKYFFISTVVAVFSYFLVYLFLSIAILFISRTVGLFLAVIVSPIAFVSRVVPALQKKSFIGFDDWMKQFFGMAFMAPIFLFFLYISIQFLDIKLSNGDGSFFGIIAKIAIKIMIIGAFLIFAKKMAKDMSGKIGEMATSAVTSVVTGAAMVAGAAATGGSSAALAMTRRLAVNKATQVIGGGDQKTGDQRVEAWQQRLGGMRNFSTFNPRKFGVGAATMLSGGSQVPGKIDAAITQGQQLGNAVNRAKNINMIRDAKKGTSVTPSLEAGGSRLVTPMSVSGGVAPKPVTIPGVTTSTNKPAVPKTTTPGVPTFGDAEVDKVMREQLAEGLQKKQVPVSTNTYDQFKKDNEKLADVMGQSAQGFNPDNLKKLFEGGNKKSTVPQVKPSASPNQPEGPQQQLAPNLFNGTVSFDRPDTSSEAPSFGDAELDAVMRGQLQGTPKIPQPPRINRTAVDQLVTNSSSVGNASEKSSTLLKTISNIPGPISTSTNDGALQKFAERGAQQEKVVKDFREKNDLDKGPTEKDAVGWFNNLPPLGTVTPSNTPVNKSTPSTPSPKQKFLDKMVARKNESTAQPSGALDQSNIVADNLPGDFGGIPLPPKQE